MKVFICVVLVSLTSASSSLIQMLDLQKVLSGLAFLDPEESPYNKISTAYQMNANLTNYLLTFSSRTQFCDYKCEAIYNLPCFILFGCNIQIRNFVLIFIFPFIILAIAGMCCGRGLWSFGCWLKYLGILSGVGLIFWAIKKCADGGTVSETKWIPKEKQRKEKVKNHTTYDIEPCETAERMRNRQSSSSSSSNQD